VSTRRKQLAQLDTSGIGPCAEGTSTNQTEASDVVDVTGEPWQRARFTNVDRHGVERSTRRATNPSLRFGLIAQAVRLARWRGHQPSRPSCPPCKHPQQQQKHSRVGHERAPP
jgi:hypothetical protein